MHPVRPKLCHQPSWPKWKASFPTSCISMLKSHLWYQIIVNKWTSPKPQLPPPYLPSDPTPSEPEPVFRNWEAQPTNYLHSIKLPLFSHPWLFPSPGGHQKLEGAHYNGKGPSWHLWRWKYQVCRAPSLPPTHQKPIPKYGSWVTPAPLSSLEQGKEATGSAQAMPSRCPCSYARGLSTLLCALALMLQRAALQNAVTLLERGEEKHKKRNINRQLLSGKHTLEKWSAHPSPERSTAPRCNLTAILSTAKWPALSCFTPLTIHPSHLSPCRLPTFLLSWLIVPPSCSMLLPVINPTSPQLPQPSELPLQLHQAWLISPGFLKPLIPLLSCSLLP